MKRIGINLATRPYGNQVLPALVLGALLLAAVGATTANVYYYVTRARDAAAFAALIEQAREDSRALAEEEKRLARDLASEDVEKINEYVSLANHLLQRRGFSWTLLFNRLETVQPYRVQLEAVQPSVGQEGISIAITGEAEKHGHFLEYIDRLEESPNFSRVLPVSESYTNRGTIRFMLRMNYDPAAGPDSPRAGPALEPEGETSPAEAEVKA